MPPEDNNNFNIDPALLNNHYTPSAPGFFNNDNNNSSSSSRDDIDATTFWALESNRPLWDKTLGQLNHKNEDNFFASK